MTSTQMPGALESASKKTNPETLPYFESQPPRTYSVAKLGSVAYLGFLEWMPSDDGHTSSVHAAEIHHPVHGRTEVCVKLFQPRPDTPNHRGLINEVTGWMMANILSIDQPKAPAVIHVPLSKLKNRKGWLRSLPADVTHWPGFCTERLNAKSAAVAYGNRLTPALTADLQAWPQLAAAVLLDEHIANIDRHANNLLRTGPKKFAVFDHDRLACHDVDNPHWANPNPADEFDNRLHHRVWPTGRSIPGDIQQDAFSMPLWLHAELGELAYWADILIDDAADKTDWLAFVQHRAWALSDLIAKRFGMLHAPLGDGPTPLKLAERFPHAWTIF